MIIHFYATKVNAKSIADIANFDVIANNLVLHVLLSMQYSPHISVVPNLYFSAKILNLDSKLQFRIYELLVTYEYKGICFGDQFLKPQANSIRLMTHSLATMEKINTAKHQKA